MISRKIVYYKTFWQIAVLFFNLHIFFIGLPSMAVILLCNMHSSSNLLFLLFNITIADCNTKYRFGVLITLFICYIFFCRCCADKLRSRSIDPWTMCDFKIYDVNISKSYTIYNKNPTAKKYILQIEKQNQPVTTKKTERAETKRK